MFTLVIDVIMRIMWVQRILTQCGGSEYIERGVSINTDKQCCACILVHIVGERELNVVFLPEERYDERVNSHICQRRSLTF